MAGVPLISILFSPGVVGTILERSASEEQKQRWLPGVASGETRLSFAITEPDAGSTRTGSRPSPVATATATS